MAAGMSMGLGDRYGLQCRGAGKLQEGFLVGTCWESTRMGERWLLLFLLSRDHWTHLTLRVAAPRDEPCT